MRQAICLSHPEVPLVKSGYESTYMKYTSSVIHAKYDGKCIEKNDKYMVIKYINNQIDIINLWFKESKEFDRTLYTQLCVNDDFKQNDVLAYTRNINKETCELMLGKNILIGIYSDRGDYEDAIIVSESCAKKMSYTKVAHNQFVLEENEVLNTLSDENSYIPIYENGTYVHKGDPIFNITSFDISNITAFTPINKNILAPSSGYFYSKIYIKKETSIDTRMNKWLKEQIEITKTNEDYFKSFIPEGDKNVFIPEYCYLDYRKKINIKTLLIDYFIVNEEVPVSRGTKLCNRFGNKGVVSIVKPDNEMPRLPDGRYLELVFNPLSPVARMNISQMFEMHINWAMENYISKYKNSPDEIFKEKILEFINIIDSTENKDYSLQSRNFIEEHPEVLEDIKINGLEIIMPPFVNNVYNRLEKLLELSEVEMMTDITFPNGRVEKCTVGKGYILRLEHEPDKKIFGRSIGVYGKFGQAPGGTNAHRLGEMESWALYAYEANNVITEFYNSKADNPEERTRLLAHLIDGKESIYQPANKQPLTKQIYDILIKTIGMEFTDDPD
jgi:DNA-directed RNA polymerase beta subunit